MGAGWWSWSLSTWATAAGKSPGCTSPCRDCFSEGEMVYHCLSRLADMEESLFLYGRGMKYKVQTQEKTGRRFYSEIIYPRCGTRGGWQSYVGGGALGEGKHTKLTLLLLLCLIGIFILNNAPLQTISSPHQWDSAGSPIKRVRILNFPQQQQDVILPDCRRLI